MRLAGSFRQSPPGRVPKLLGNCQAISVSIAPWGYHARHKSVSQVSFFGGATI